MDITKSEITVDLNAKTRSVDISGWIKDDVIQPFLIEATGLTGRFVKLGPSVNDILTRHASGQRRRPR